MTYAELYNMVKALLQSVYSIALPELPQLEATETTVKTYGDLSTGSKCSWSNEIIPVYIPKEWEKDPTVGLIINE